MYRYINNFQGQTAGVQRLSDMASIPFDPANTDYQEFLRWKSEGNEPLPADDNGQAAE